MKFQDSSFNALKVTVGTKSVTHARTHPPTHAPKAICPINFFIVGGINIGTHLNNVLRKPTIRVSDHVRHKLGCTATGNGLRLEITDLGRRGIALSM